MITKLHDVFGTLTKALEILFVAEGVKPCARQGFYSTELERIKEFCKDNNLHITTSDYKIVLDSKTNKGAYSNKGERADLSDPREGMLFTYISRSKDKAEKAKKYENLHDHISLGLTLGYPQCCCEFFKKHEPEESKKNNDYIIPILNNSEGFSFPKEANICGRYFDYTLLNHFPCSFNCKESVSLAKKYLNIIMKYDEDLAFQILDVLGSAIVYHEFAGVFLLHDYHVENNNLKFRSMMETKKCRLSEDLNEFKNIEIIDKNAIKIDGQKVGDPNFGFMIFS